MKHLKLLSTIAGVFTLSLLLAPNAGAVPITGSLAFSGGASPSGGSDWSTATGIIFGPGTTVSSAPTPPTGDFAGTGGSAATFTDFTFTPFSSVLPLWTFTFMGDVYAFDLLSIASISQPPANGNSSSLGLIGSGILKKTGFDDTIATFILGATGAGDAFSFSASTAAADLSSVPEPGAMILLGTGLLGLAGLARRRRAAAL